MTYGPSGFFFLAYLILADLIPKRPALERNVSSDEAEDLLLLLTDSIVQMENVLFCYLVCCHAIVISCETKNILNK